MKMLKSRHEGFLELEGERAAGWGPGSQPR